MPTWKTKRGYRYQFYAGGVRYYNRAKDGRPSFYQTKAEAKAAEAEHRAQVKTPQQTGMVFSELANEYLDFSQRAHAVKTYKYKRYVFRTFIAFAGDLPLDRISLPVLESFCRSRHSNHNYNVFRKELCALLSWGWRRRYIAENPCLWLTKLPEERKTKLIPTPEEMSKLFLAAGKDRPFLLVLYHTLARVDEILRLRWEDVNFQERTLTLWTRKRSMSAWGHDPLPMNQVLYQTLKGLWQVRTGKYVFMNPKTKTRFNHRPKLMKGLCLRAGIRLFGFHSIRHFVASLLHDREKVSLPQVSKLLRHQNKATTERYLQVVDQGAREALAKLENGFSQLRDSTQS